MGGFGGALPDWGARGEVDGGGYGGGAFGAQFAFGEPEAEVEHAGRVIAAFEQASREGRGVVTVDGRMVENLHVENARRVLATAEAVAALA